MSISKGDEKVLFYLSPLLPIGKCAVDVEGVAQRSNIIRLAVAGGADRRGARRPLAALTALAAPRGIALRFAKT
jgi:hypothetical protein